MSEEQNEWFRISSAGNLGIDFLDEGKIVEVEVEGRKICIARDGNELFAITSRCPHNGANLENGIVEPGAVITCPLHRFRFCMKTGKNLSGEGFFLKHYPLEMRRAGLFISLPAKKKWGWF